MEKHSASAASSWHAPTALTIYEVADIALGQVLSGLARQGGTLDLSGLVELDAAGVQWLLLSKRLLARQGITLKVANLPPCHRVQFERLGVAAQLLQPGSDDAAPEGRHE